ncbi:hypothetical protein [Salinibacter ruber]|uniref:Uncharacterized protein n=1 Tax=Salinibacter ruber TaxID=146919 RepID=A0A9X2Q8Y9_9BACT|nr:hypothetical protein [Salinibacter ruber]MCS3661830.1 hypothetical protein [Salinibacter ruber]MCS3711621.1 hypothetical protein [Salinibacter ruber]
MPDPFGYDNRPETLQETDLSIGLDLDGTLVAFARGFVQKAKEEGVQYYDHYSVWNQWAAPDRLEKNFFKMWDVLEDNWEFWTRLDPLEKAYVPYEVTAYVTSRSSAPEGAGEHWIKKNEFPPAPVFRVGEALNKLNRLMWINDSPNESLDVFVDDKAATVREVHTAWAHGQDVPFPLLITTPANSRFSNEKNSDLPRVDYLAEVPKAARHYINK